MRVCWSPPHTRPSVGMRPQRRSLLSRSAAAGPPRAPGRAAAFELPPQGQLAPCRCCLVPVQWVEGVIPGPGAGVEGASPVPVQVWKCYSRLHSHTHTAQRVEQQQGVIVPARGSHSEATSGRQASEQRGRRRLPTEVPTATELPTATEGYIGAMLLIASMKTRCCGFEKLPHARTQSGAADRSGKTRPRVRRGQAQSKQENPNERTNKRTRQCKQTHKKQTLRFRSRQPAAPAHDGGVCSAPVPAASGIAASVLRRHAPCFSLAATHALGVTAR